jgi:hypothetical protein
VSIPAQRRFLDRVGHAARRLAETEQLPFQDLLSADLVNDLLDELNVSYRDGIYTPQVTLWAFLSQVLGADHSCRQAVARVSAFRFERGLPACSPQTGAYCTARSRLPEEFFNRLVRKTGEQPAQHAERTWLWKGRHVKIVDGTTVTMPDTPENQAAWPQQENQKPGAGFPIVRLVVVLSLAVGTALEWAIGPYQGKGTGENQLFRSLMGHLSDQDIVLADRYYASWWDFALLARHGVDLVARLHQHRRADFRRGVHLGPCDQLVVWRKPRRPDWLDPVTYAELPGLLLIRELKVHVRIPGFRVRNYMIATTLWDHELYTPEDIAELYRARWHAELDLRSIKTTMQMDHLRCKTPEMVRRELAMYLLAYNLIRGTMVEAARLHDLQPREISFKGAVQTLNAYRDRGLLKAPSVELLATLLTAIAAHRVGDRPDRVEPRLVKRRPKQYKHLHEPRQVARMRLCRGA